MLTDDQLLSAFFGRDARTEMPIHAESLRRVEAAVRADVAAEVRARASKWQSGSVTIAENGGLPIVIAKAGFAADALSDAADEIEKAGAP